MNSELLNTLYDMLKYYINKNEIELKEYNRLKEMNVSPSYLDAYKNRMWIAVERFRAIKPYYIKYYENPSKELEKEIVDKFRDIIIEYVKDKKNIKIKSE